MGGQKSPKPTLDVMRQVLDGMPQLVKIVDLEGRLVYANPRLLALLGIGPEVLGKRADDVDDPAIAATLRRCYRDAIDVREPTTVEVEVELAGKPRRLSATHIPLWERGERHAVCTVAVDETERHAVEQELVRANGQLRTMIEAYDDVLMLVNPEAEIQFINYTITGRPPEEVIGSSLYDYVAPEFRERMRSSLGRVIATHEPDRYSAQYIQDGEETFWECRAFPVVTGDEVNLITVVASNVTERRAKEEEQNRFFKISEDILCIIDQDGNFKSVNPAFKRVLGYSAEEMIGTPFIELIHPDDRQSTFGIIEAVRAKNPGDSNEFVNRYRHKEGGYRRIAWRGAADPITGAAYGVGRDVTERHALEEKLRQAQKMEAVGQLAGGIAHDFNNIALSILLNAELGLRSGEGDVIPKSFREIRDAAQRAADLTRQLLAFSRQTVADFEYLCLNHVAEGVMRLLRRLIPENIAVDFIRGEDMPAIRADRGQLEQVIMNLCLNARDAMPDGGRIEIEIRAVTIGAADASHEPELRPGHHVSLSVADTGTGIESDVIPRIFEPFFTTKPPGSGTGLGLATVYGVIQQHNGMIRVESEPGVGTRFVVHLPASQRRVTKTVSEPAAPVEGGTETILLAEDEALVRAVVVRTLTEAGYAVVVAKDGLEAVELAQRNDAVELVLLDMVMPNLSGTEAFERIRELRPDVRFLFSSGYVGVLPHRGDDLEPVPIIRKPYRPDELLREIRRILDD